MIATTSETGNRPAVSPTEPAELPEVEVERIRNEFQQELALYNDAVGKAQARDYEGALESG